MSVKLKYILVFFLANSMNYAHADNICPTYFITKPSTALFIPKQQLGYEVKIYTSDVKKQCFGTCGFESHMSQLESLMGIKLNYQYNSLLLLINRAINYLKHPDKLPINKKFVSIIDGAALEHMPIDIASHGVLLYDAFKIDQNLLTEITRSINVQMDTEILNDIMSNKDTFEINYINYLLSALFVEVKQKKVEEVIIRIIRLLDAAVDPYKALAQTTYKDHFGKYSLFNVYKLKPTKESLRVSASKAWEVLWKNDSNLSYSNHAKSSVLSKTIRARREKIEQVILSNLKHGRPVQIGFNISKNHINSSTGLVQLDRIYNDQKKLTSIDSESLEDSGHGAVIESYKYSSDGRLIFLIKDSQGEDSYDNGYLHVESDYLFSNFIGISVYSK